MTHAQAVSALGPFRHKLFRAIWMAALIANVGIWMQTVGAAWLMTALTPSPLMVALIQTATSLPAFLLGLPAGVLADLTDRRRILVATHAWLLLTSICLSTLMLLGSIGPWSLLLLTFMLGVGFALSVPAWQASTSDAVPRAALLPAIALNAIAYNVARAVGPALAGAVIAALGSNAVFLVNCVLFAVVLIIFVHWYKPPPSPNPPSERLFSAMRVGMRYVRHSHALHAQMVRTGVFISCASSLWALLPLVARDLPGFGAGAYGLLLGSLGVGAVLGGTGLARLRERYTLDTLAGVASGVFGATVLTAAYVQQIAVLCTALIAGGAAWIIFNSTISAAFQTALPAWVRARALAVFMLLFQGSMALGGVIWGSAASHLGVSDALTVAAALIVAGYLLTKRYPLRMGKEAEVTPSMHWTEPAVVGELSPEDGPVSVQINYRVLPEMRENFVRAIYAIGATRKRDGATHWRLYRDLSDPGLYIERFIVDSWAEYRLQQARAMVADREAQEGLRRFLAADSAPAMSHLIAEPCPPREA